MTKSLGTGMDVVRYQCEIEKQKKEIANGFFFILHAQLHTSIFKSKVSIHNMDTQRYIQVNI
jgi:hypothetical protein